jgi:O-antigen/teichoic acid export membrane protein
MKKDITMKKSTFVKGAFITTFGIVITKLLGVVYVIPFHGLIGEKGGALYGYAYTIYNVFMSLATAGIPLAISRIVSEYQAMGYYNTKKRVFLLSKRLALLLGFIFFLIILLFAPFLSKAVLGNVVGGNTVEDVTFVIRMIGTAILIVPVLSIYRGYFEGHRFMSPPSISQVIEQAVRVFIIILGSYLTLKVFHGKLTTAVGIALLGATVGAFISYIYLVEKKFKNKSKFNEKIRSVNEPIITNKVILYKIIIYAVPFIMIDVFKTLYNIVDMVTVVKGLVHYAQYSTKDAESIYAMLSTWANKFNMIVLAVSSGIIVNLIPNLTESIVKDNRSDIQSKIVRSITLLLSLAVPITLGISFLAKPIWALFYGDSIYGSSVLSYYIFVGFFIGLLTVLLTILQTFKDYRNVFISLIIGIFIKILLNNNLMQAFYQMGVPAYYGVISASIIGYLVSIIYCFFILNRKYHITFEVMIKDFFDILCGSVLMVLVLFLIRIIVPIISANRLLNLLWIIIYMFIGMIVYFAYAYYTKLIERVLGKSIMNNIKNRLFDK